MSTTPASASAAAPGAAAAGARPTPGGPRRLVLWFRNDLRLHDNYIVHEAVQLVKSKQYDDVSKERAGQPALSIPGSFLPLERRVGPATRSLLERTHLRMHHAECDRPHSN
jgi:hypothetical protein